jgi:hypothetical protein
VSNGKTMVEGWQAPYRKPEVMDKAALEAGNPAFLTAKEIGAASPPLAGRMPGVCAKPVSVGGDIRFAQEDRQDRRGETSTGT